MPNTLELFIMPKRHGQLTEFSIGASNGPKAAVYNRSALASVCLIPAQAVRDPGCDPQRWRRGQL